MEEKRNSSGAWVSKEVVSDRCSSLIRDITQTREDREDKVILDWLERENAFRKWIPFVPQVTLEDSLEVNGFTWGLRDDIEFASCKWYADDQLSKAKELLRLCQLTTDERIWLSAEDCGVLFENE